MFTFSPTNNKTSFFLPIKARYIEIMDKVFLDDEDYWTTTSRTSSLKDPLLVRSRISNTSHIANVCPIEKPRLRVRLLYIYLSSPCYHLYHNIYLFIHFHFQDRRFKQDWRSGKKVQIFQYAFLISYYSRSLR